MSWKIQIENPALRSVCESYFQPVYGAANVLVTIGVTS